MRYRYSIYSNMCRLVRLELVVISFKKLATFSRDEKMKMGYKLV